MEGLRERAGLGVWKCYDGVVASECGVKVLNRCGLWIRKWYRSWWGYECLRERRSQVKGLSDTVMPSWKAKRLFCSRIPCLWNNQQISSTMNACHVRVAFFIFGVWYCVSSGQIALLQEMLFTFIDSIDQLRGVSGHVIVKVKSDIANTHH
jgi:hypothetical protein